MAISVPDESLCTALEADRYHEDRGNSAQWASMDQLNKEQLLRQAFDFLFALYGAAWPADRAFGTLADGSVPVPMRNACCILALKAKAGPLMPEATPQKIESTVGPITTKFAPTAIAAADRFPEIALLVRPYLPKVTGNPYQASVGRA